MEDWPKGAEQTPISLKEKKEDRGSKALSEVLGMG